MFHFSLLYLFIYFLGSQQPPQQYGNIQYKNSAILNRINWLVANQRVDKNEGVIWREHCTDQMREREMGILQIRIVWNIEMIPN